MVIAILLILAGLLFPVFAQGRKSAHNTVCAANLGNIAKAVHLYVADSDDAYPPVVEPYLVNFFEQVGEEHAKSSEDLPSALHPYVGSNAVFRCPRDIGMRYADFLQFDSTQLPSSFASSGSSYWFNEQLYFSDATTTSVAYPSSTALVNDRTGAWHEFEEEGEVPGAQQLYKVSKDYRYNTVFTDGHISKLTPRQLNAAKGAVYGRDWIVNVDIP